MLILPVTVGALTLRLRIHKASAVVDGTTIGFGLVIGIMFTVLKLVIQPYHDDTSYIVL